MFTGIVENVGTVESLDMPRLRVACDFADLSVGESIAVNGVCLTVASLSDGVWSAEISEETAAITTLSGLEPGDLVNLERAMPAGGRFGGHIVQGHVDGIATVTSRKDLEDSTIVWFDLDPAMSRYLVPKGSVSVDGVSLTIARRGDSELLPGNDAFCVALVPHTLKATTLNMLHVGQSVNIEVDLLAKYIESLISERIT